MDKNKRIKLQQINYRIGHTCGICTHGHWFNTDWGTCNHHTYDHEKHNENRRNLSIHRSGTCELFSLKDEKKAELETWAEFME